jgi:hypothetical protein
MRARGSHGTDGAGCRPDSNLSPSLARGEDDPNRWGSPVSERMGKGRGSRPRGRTRLGKGKLSVFYWLPTEGYAQGGKFR